MRASAIAFKLRLSEVLKRGADGQRVVFEAHGEAFVGMSAACVPVADIAVTIPVRIAGPEFQEAPAVPARRVAANVAAYRVWKIKGVPPKAARQANPIGDSRASGAFLLRLPVGIAPLGLGALVGRGRVQRFLIVLVFQGIESVPLKLDERFPDAVNALDAGI